MTPELPRAPMSDPFEIARQAALMASPPAVSRSMSSSARATLSTVSAMLVPVSPSGTGIDVQPVHDVAVHLQGLREGAHGEDEALRGQAGSEVAFCEISGHRWPAGRVDAGDRWWISRGFIPLDANVTPRPVVGTL